MSVDSEAIDQSCTAITSECKPYDQFLLFGDSITEQSGTQERGFAFAPALQDGTHPTFHTILEIIP
jgi:hypothetical protein